jgi:hypothetical protein
MSSGRRPPSRRCRRLPAHGRRRPTSASRISPTRSLLDALEIEDPLDLTGLYQGVDLARRSYFDPGAAGSEVFLFRLPIG